MRILTCSLVSSNPLIQSRQKTTRRAFNGTIPQAQKQEVAKDTATAMKPSFYPSNPSEVVKTAIDGFLLAHPHLARLDGYGADVKVVVQRDVDRSKVSVICGGGSGHEPAHAGLVGKGLLTAAVCGEVFASPSSDAVYAAIKHTTGDAGCLLLIKNYTGDRLNFGLAAELAKQEGLKVELVVVGDDAALETGHNITGRRGIAGTVLVEKNVGALAASGASLEEVAQYARDLAARIATVGLSLSVCTLPLQKPSDRIAPGEMELGLGIHGESGHAKVPFVSLQDSVDRLFALIESSGYLPLPKGSRVVLLANNLGAATPLEMAAFTKACVDVAAAKGLVVERVLSGAFMTSLDMHGVSLSLLKVTSEKDLELLDAAHTAPAWPQTPAAPLTALPAPVPCTAVKEQKESGALATGGVAINAEEALATVRAAMDAVLQAEPLITETDQKVGDGDCGLTHSNGARTILQDLALITSSGDLASLFDGLRQSVRKSMAGSSGALYNIALVGATTAAKEGKDAVSSMLEGAGAMMKYGGAKEGDRTMLDALLPGLRVLKETGDLGAAAKAAREGAERTKEMNARAGRSSYVPLEVLQTCPDPGALVVAAMFEGVAKAKAGGNGGGAKAQ